MFIVWGTKRTERKTGWISDYCTICDDVRAHRLIELRMVSHLYYIPLGRGKVAGHIRRCKQCKNFFVTNPERYAEVSKNIRGSIEELTDTTYPDLVEVMANYLDLRDRAASGEETEEERRELLFYPFTSIVYTATMRVKGFDLTASHGSSYWR